MAFAKFMAGPVGRGVRVVAGLLLMFWGFRQGTTMGTIAGVFGVVALAAGAFNWCLIAPLIGAPFKGSDALKKGQGS
jgi:hypothetical protein